MSRSAFSRTTVRILRPNSSEVLTLSAAAAAAAYWVLTSSVGVSGLLPGPGGYGNTDTRHDRRHGEANLLVSLVTLEPERVAARDVGHLVAEDHRELSLVVEPAQEPRVHVDAAVRHRERVERRVAHHAEPEPRPPGRPHPVGQEPVAELAEVFLQERVVVDLRLLGERLLFLLGLGPQADFVGLGLEGLAAGADRGDVPGCAGGGQEGRDQDPRDRAGWRAPAARLEGHSPLQPYTRQV